MKKRKEVMLIIVLVIVLLFLVILYLNKPVKTEGVVNNLKEFFSFKWLAEMLYEKVLFAPPYGGCSSDDDCNDNNPCTVDYCKAGECINEYITSCTNEDSCCPSGCTSSNDNDCIICGDGSCDSGETCSNCQSDCGGCGGGGDSCIPICTNRKCGDDRCGGTCPPGCPAGQICNALGECVTSCTDTCSGLEYECGTQEICGDDTNCGSCSSGQTCENGKCVEKESEEEEKETEEETKEECPETPEQTTGSCSCECTDPGIGGFFKDVFLTIDSYVDFFNDDLIENKICVVEVEVPEGCGEEFEKGITGAAIGGSATVTFEVDSCDVSEEECHDDPDSCVRAYYIDGACISHFIDGCTRCTDSDSEYEYVFTADSYYRDSSVLLETFGKREPPELPSCSSDEDCPNPRGLTMAGDICLNNKCFSTHANKCLPPPMDRCFSGYSCYYPYCVLNSQMGIGPVILLNQETKSDYCDDENYLIEYGCGHSYTGVGSVVKENKHKCPLGCEGSSCIKCIDSDSGEYNIEGCVPGTNCNDYGGQNIKGNVSFVTFSGISDYANYCEDFCDVYSQTLFECYCGFSDDPYIEGITGLSEFYPCSAFGKYSFCGDGVCISEAGCKSDADCKDPSECTVDTCSPSGSCSNIPDDNLCPPTQMCSYKCIERQRCIDDTGCTIPGYPYCINKVCSECRQDSHCPNGFCNEDNKCEAQQCTEGATRPTTCGVGICEGNTGIETCNNEQWGSDTCNPFEGFVNEICNDNLDNDCDGAVDLQDSDCGGSCSDNDDDGYNAVSINCLSGTDCNDNNAAINPGAIENCNDGVDNDCDGAIDWVDSDCLGFCVDLDYDFHYAISPDCPSGDDCDDNNGAVYPGAIENCNNLIDDDCDSLIDEDDSDCLQGGCSNCGGNMGLFACDRTECEGLGYCFFIEWGFGLGSCYSCSNAYDCIDYYTDQESCLDNVCRFGPPDCAFEDDTCKTMIPDNDGDGYSPPEDCDDNNEHIYPDAPEICDGLDNQCPGDEEYGEIDESFTKEECSFVCEANYHYWIDSNTGDLKCCGDNINEANPYEIGIELSCGDYNDNDCDGLVDRDDSDCIGCIEGEEKDCGSDAGECEKGTQTCNSGVWGICRNNINPTNEVCDGLDNDCDGSVDEGNVCKADDFWEDYFEQELPTSREDIETIPTGKTRTAAALILGTVILGALILATILLFRHLRKKLKKTGKLKKKKSKKH